MNYSHGKSGSRLYTVWNAMKARCSNPNNHAYERYGGRGIGYCARWEQFANFYEDMGDAPKGHTLERLENNKGYSTENCIWADRSQQGRNKRNNVMLTIDGETLPLVAWAERYGIAYGTVHRRLWHHKWSPEDAVKLPLVVRRKGIKRGLPLHGVTFQDDRTAV